MDAYTTMRGILLILAGYSMLNGDMHGAAFYIIVVGFLQIFS
jgi:hypothetical protein